MLKKFSCLKKTVERLLAVTDRVEDPPEVNSNRRLRGERPHRFLERECSPIELFGHLEVTELVVEVAHSDIKRGGQGRIAALLHERSRFVVELERALLFAELGEDVAEA